MFTIIWRGAGIIVPILFVGIGYIVSFWFEDTRLGNPDFIGWTAFYSGIALTVLGLGLNGPAPHDENNQPLPKGKHDFFFIPVVFWGIFLLGLGIYFNWIKSDAVETSDTEISPEIQDRIDELMSEMKQTRTLNIYNGASEDLIYDIYDHQAEDYYSDTIEAFMDTEIELKSGFGRFYTAYGINLSDQYVFIQDKAANRDYFEEHSDTWSEYLDGKSGKMKYRRQFQSPTARTDDYDEAWLCIDGLHDFFLLEVTSACREDVTMDFIESVDWERKIKEWYDGRDIMEPLYGVNPLGKNLIVRAPWVVLPKDITRNDKVYALVPYNKGQTVDQDFIVERIGKLCKLID